MRHGYSTSAPERVEVDALPGAAVLEFGTGWCGHCIAAQPAIEAVMAARPDVTHLKIEDGPWRRLGRSFRVKLWPTFVFLWHGQEVARVVRPTSRAALDQAMAKLDGPERGSRPA